MTSHEEHMELLRKGSKLLEEWKRESKTDHKKYMEQIDREMEEMDREREESSRKYEAEREERN